MIDWRIARLSGGLQGPDLVSFSASLPLSNFARRCQDLLTHAGRGATVPSHGICAALLAVAKCAFAVLLVDRRALLIRVSGDFACNPGFNLHIQTARITPNEILLQRLRASDFPIALCLTAVPSAPRVSGAAATMPSRWEGRVSGVSRH